MLSLGDVLQLNNRNWTVVGPLPGGVGGFGTVYVVEDEDGYEAVAKLVPKDPAAERELLIGAATRAARIRHSSGVFGGVNGK